MIATDDIRFFMEMLAIDSTSGKERVMAQWLGNRLSSNSNKVELIEVGDGTFNLRCSWGTPKVWLCSHCDTVPPYIPPSLDDDWVRGRGSCDAKGQIFSMFLAAKELETQNVTDFGILILAGEETGSFGAKAYTRDYEGSKAVIVGEPTDNKMVKASKGTRAFAITIGGKACHSGYPQLGESAVMKFVDFINSLKEYSFPVDEILGETTWNVGELISDNRQNILSDRLTFRLYFRTTFASSETVPEVVKALLPKGAEIVDFGGDIPLHYTTFKGFETTTVAFGSDAPRLTKFDKKILCGPGSIQVAHTDKEYITLGEIEKAASQYVSFVKKLLNFE